MTVQDLVYRWRHELSRGAGQWTPAVRRQAGLVRTYRGGWQKW